MLGKFIEWKNHLKEQKPVTKPSQINSLFKTLKWAASQEPDTSSNLLEQINNLHALTCELTRLEIGHTSELLQLYILASSQLGNAKSDQQTTMSPKSAAQQIQSLTSQNQPKVMVIDFEMYCDDKPCACDEIIEFGVVVVDIREKVVVERYEALTKTSSNKKLTEFCTKLTGITNAMMDENAIEFQQAYVAFCNILTKHNIASIIQWGSGDIKHLKKDAKLRGLNTLLIDSITVIDLKKPFAISHGSTKRIGLSKAMKRAGIESCGDAHRALVDAENTASILLDILNRGSS